MKDLTHDDLLKVAITYLESARKMNLESVDISTYNHEDGTLSLSIDVVYPPSKDEEKTTIYKFANE